MKNSKLQKLFSKASTERQQAVLVFMAHRLARYGEPVGQGRVRIKRCGLDIISQAITAPDAATARFLEISTAITHHNKPVFSGTVRYRFNQRGKVELEGQVIGPVQQRSGTWAEALLTEHDKLVPMWQQRGRLQQVLAHRTGRQTGRQTGHQTGPQV